MFKNLRHGAKFESECKTIVSRPFSGKYWELFERSHISGVQFQTNMICHLARRIAAAHSLPSDMYHDDVSSQAGDKSSRPLAASFLPSERAALNFQFPYPRYSYVLYPSLRFIPHPFPIRSSPYPYSQVWLQEPMTPDPTRLLVFCQLQHIPPLPTTDIRAQCPSPAWTPNNTPDIHQTLSPTSTPLRTAVLKAQTLIASKSHTPRLL